VPGKVTLEVTAGPIRGRVFTFDEHDTFLFGRGSDCHAQLSADDATASRNHFILEVNPPAARIRDLGSLNGTFVNGVKYGGRAAGESPEQAARRTFPEVDVRDADEISVGESTFTLHVDVPAVCCGCGMDIPDAFKSLCHWLPGTFICPQCREKAEKGGRSPQAAPVRCRICGGDASDELPPGSRGDYVCQVCQATSLNDPAEVVKRALSEEARTRGDAVPTDIVGYEIVRILEQGGMGAVYVARRKADGTAVALKVMLARVAVDERARQLFQREIEVSRALKHRHIVALIDHGSAGSGFYFVMEMCAGGGLHHLVVRRGGRLDVAEAVPLMLQALDGLAFAHDQGFVHRDLKPSNILLTAPEAGEAKIADFGFAKNFQKAGLSGMTATGSAAGTVAFMPREQLTNFKFVKPSSDVWSMGATFYNVLTGALPLDFPRGQDRMQVILQAPVVPIRQRDGSIPRGLAEVIDRSIASVKERYQTAGEFAEALRKVL
jgi:serine/threonine-protein kinase